VGILTTLFAYNVQTTHNITYLNCNYFSIYLSICRQWKCLEKYKLQCDPISFRS